MRTNINLSCASDGDGGVTVSLSGAGFDISMPLGHEAALRLAGTVLARAGVARAEYEDGRIREMARS